MARYTERLINQLANDGECFELVVGRVNEMTARSRISNAAFRAGLPVTTELDRPNYRVWGYVKEGA